MNDLWLWLNGNSEVVWGAALFLLGLASPEAARRIRRMTQGSKKR